MPGGFDEAPLSLRVRAQPPTLSDTWLVQRRRDSGASVLNSASMRQQHVRSRALLQGSLIAASAALLVHCGESEPESQFVPRDPCQSVYAGRCGSGCTGDDDCASGLHCAQSQCTAQCGGSDSLCDKGAGCSSRGRCTSGSGGAGGTGIIGPRLDGGAGSSNGGSGGDAGVCADIALKVAPTTPTVVLVIDQSGSMTDANFPQDGQSPVANRTRWAVLKRALLDPTNGVIRRLEGQVRFGTVLYGNRTNDSPAVCPELTRIMPPRLNNYSAINDVYGDAGTIPNTPTAESLTAVTASLDAFNEPGPKYMILATDGDPDTCADPNDHGAAAQQMSENAVRAAWAKRIGTYVIAVGDDATEDHLNRLAHLGQGLDATNLTRTLFFQPANQTALAEAFSSIIDGVRTCDFTLNGKIDPARAGQGRVTLDGSAVPLNATNGWTVDATGKKLTLHGAPCTTIKTGTHDLRAVFPCSAIVEPPVPE